MGLVRDPDGWVRKCFDTAWQLGFRWIRFHQPPGHDASLELYRAGIFRDQASVDALCEETENYMRGGGSVCLYMGKINPDTGKLLRATDTWWESLDQWIDSGGARLEFDNTSVDPAEQDALGGVCVGKGLQSAGEYYPFTTISGGQHVLKSAAIRAWPWVILHDSARALDQRRLWRVNPATTELRQLVYAPHFVDPRLAVDYIRDIKARGQIADQLEVQGVDPMVTEAILE